MDCIYRHPEKANPRANTILKKEVIGITKSGKISTLAESVGTGWSLMDSHWFLHPKKIPNGDGHLFVLQGKNMVCVHDPCAYVFPSHIIIVELFSLFCCHHTHTWIGSSTRYNVLLVIVISH